MLLAPAWLRLLLAAAIVSALWAVVLWTAPSTPSTSLAQSSARVAAPSAAAPSRVATGLRAVVRSGMPAPGGGRFDRFDAATQPVVTPVNAKGQVAFYATVLRSASRDGIFIAASGRITKVAAFGDPVPGGGALVDFALDPLPAINASGHVAFHAAIAGGRGTEGIFLAQDDGLHAIALSGDEAPGVPAGVLVGFEAPALNDNDELAFVASVRRGQDLIDVLYVWNGQRLQRLVAEGELLLRIGGTMNKIGVPALNNSGVVAFPAAILKGPVLGGIFVAGARALSLLVTAGETLANGAMILRFSERVAIDDSDGIAFGAYVGDSGNAREAVLRRSPNGIAVVALEGEPAPGGGRYVGFGPWPTLASDGTIAFIAALDGGPGPLAAYAGTAEKLSRVVMMGEQLPNGGTVGRFVKAAVASVAPSGALAIAIAATDANAIYCRCP